MPPLSFPPYKRAAVRPQISTNPEDGKCATERRKIITGKIEIITGIIYFFPGIIFSFHGTCFFNPNRSLDFSRIACNCRADFFCLLRRRSGLRQVKDKRKMCGKGMQGGEELNQNTLIRSNDRFGFKVRGRENSIRGRQCLIEGNMILLRPPLRPFRVQR